MNHLSFSSEDTDLNAEYLRKVAIQAGVSEIYFGLPEKVLVRAIQKQRGEEPCFLSDQRFGCRKICEWSAGCQKLKAVWLR